MPSSAIHSAAEVLLDTKTSILKWMLLGSSIYLVFWIIYCRSFHPLKGIPGPFWASVSRYWLPYQVSTGKAECTLRTLHEELGRSLLPHEFHHAQPQLVRPHCTHRPRRGVRGRSALGATDLWNKKRLHQGNHTVCWRNVHLNCPGLKCNAVRLLRSLEPRDQLLW